MGFVLMLVLIQLAVCRGAVYTRWGHTACGRSEDQLVYSGVAGGSHFSHRGGGSNYLCLPVDPEWARTKGGFTVGGKVYGSEYETKFFNPFSKNVYEHDVPCAVCQNDYKDSVMIPGRLSCYSGWSIAYKGYLMSENTIHYRTEFVCMDGSPQIRMSGSSNQNGALFYPVEGECGSLPCPPYKNGHELTCVVCLK